jgi:hypothetical protein
MEMLGVSETASEERGAVMKKRTSAVLWTRSSSHLLLIEQAEKESIDNLLLILLWLHCNFHQEGLALIFSFLTKQSHETLQQSIMELLSQFLLRAFFSFSFSVKSQYSGRERGQQSQEREREMRPLTTIASRSPSLSRIA